MPSITSSEVNAVIGQSVGRDLRLFLPPVREAEERIDR
jgi:hypothetical protein